MTDIESRITILQARLSELREELDTATMYERASLLSEVNYVEHRLQQLGNQP